jgi:hypothetical protein
MLSTRNRLKGTRPLHHAAAGRSRRGTEGQATSHHARQPATSNMPTALHVALATQGRTKATSCWWNLGSGWLGGRAARQKGGLRQRDKQRDGAVCSHPHTQPDTTTAPMRHRSCTSTSCTGCQPAVPAAAAAQSRVLWSPRNAAPSSPFLGCSRRPQLTESSNHIHTQDTTPPQELRGVSFWCKVPLGAQQPTPCSRPCYACSAIAHGAQQVLHAATPGGLETPPQNSNPTHAIKLHWVTTYSHARLRSAGKQARLVKGNAGDCCTERFQTPQLSFWVATADTSP